MVSFENDEEQIFEQTLEWLSSKLSYVPIYITKQKYSFSIDYFTRTFIDGTGAKVYLTAKEFDLFYLLFTHKEQVFSKEQLYESVWGYNHIYDSRNLTAFIRKLRKKIEPDPNCPQYIVTVWGVGYKFVGKEKP